MADDKSPITSTPDLSSISSSFAGPKQASGFASLMSNLGSVSLPQDFVSLEGFGYPDGSVTVDSKKSNQATISVTGYGNGDETEWYLEWDTTSSFTNPSTGGGSVNGAPTIGTSTSTPTTFTHTITGLDGDKTYYVRAVMYNGFNDASSSYYYKTGWTSFTAEAGFECTTSAPPTIYAQSAQLKGSYSSTQEYTTVTTGFEYRKTGSSTWTSVTLGSYDSSGLVFYQTVSGLEPSTEYEARATAENAAGTRSDKGSVQTFTTQEASVTASTGSVSNVGSSSATLSGSYSKEAVDENATVYFQWREASNYFWNDTTKTTQPSGSFSETITGLSEDTNYDFRAVAETTNYSDTGSIQAFTTSSINPSISCSSDGATSVGTQSATLNGSYSKQDISSDADVRFKYKQSSSSTWSYTSWKSRSPGSFSETVSGLDSDTNYEFQAIAEAGGYSDSGYDDTFKTDQKNPSLSCTTKQVGLTQTNTAQLRGSYSEQYLSGDATVYFEYKKTSSSTWNTTGTRSEPDGSFLIEATGLDTDTSYEYRAVAEIGGKSDKGSTKPFSTDSVNPYLSCYTDGASTDTDGADVSGSFQGANFGSVHAYFKYRKDENSSWNTVDADNSPFTSEGSFSARINDGSDMQQKYEYQAWVEGDNNTGGSGNIHTFTTDPKYEVNADTLGENSSSITPNQAEVLGYVFGYNYGTADCYMQYREKGASSWNEVKVTTHTCDPDLNGICNNQYDYLMTGLNSDTTYEYRAKAVGENGTGTDTGTTKTLTTAAAASVNVSADNAEPEITNATIRGELTGYGFSSASATLEYTAEGGSNYFEAGTRTYSSSADRNFWDVITGLEPGTDYQARFDVSTDAGPSDTSSVITFSTRVHPEWLTVSGVGPHDGTDSSAAYRVVCIAAGANIGDGFLALQYRKVGASSWTTEKRNHFSGLHDDIESAPKISTDITGLDSNTTYEFRPKAVGRLGAYQGDTITEYSGPHTFSTTPPSS